MKLVWCSWKDIRHPLAGGAEVVTHQLLRRLVQAGHEVTLLTSRPAGQPAAETIDGYRVVRQGNRYSVYPKVAAYYRAHRLAATADVTVEEINTIPFFMQRCTKRPPLLFIHQLAREVWFHQMFWPLSRIGYFVEPYYLRRLNKQAVITISESTKQDLIKTAGFAADNISIIREGSELPPIERLSDTEKYDTLTLLSLGSVRPMKRTLDIVKAFEHAKAELPDLRLIVAGNNNGPYGEKVLDYITRSPFHQDIEVLGGVSDEKKQELMRRSHALALASVKEGWGLTVTEANSQGTPAVAYDVDGLRDSVKDGRTGLVTPPTPESLGQGIVQLLQNDRYYQKLRRAAWKDSQQYTFDNTYADFMSVLSRLTGQP